MASHIHRVTMFKLPSVESQEKLIEGFKALARDHQKDGKPYIISMSTGKAMEDQRAQGWTVVNKSEFANIEDMRFYDEHDEAHKALKQKAKTLGIEGGPSGVLTAYYESAVTI
ncbi:stress responsive A/B barrel domain-containing protein [Xylariomycetidae sp. FL2044]|nr:stress responsive A/B barrel domain-containing protein [Xylariomycetidae sp. FL2044]